MIERANSFRSHSLCEIEKYHTFQTLRRFPELHQSLQEIETLQIEYKKNFNDTKATFRHLKCKKSTMFTEKLKDLTKSSLSEINSLKDFKKILHDEKMKQKSIDSLHLSMTLPPLKELTPLESAENKLSKQAISYDNFSYLNVMDGFQGNVSSGEELTKKSFDTKLRNFLKVYLSGEELDVLFANLPKNSNNCIDCTEFVRYFFKLGESYKHKLLMQNFQKENERKTKKHIDEERLKLKEKNEINNNFTDEHLNAALSKLNHAALLFNADKDSLDSVCVTASFESHLQPHEFKTQLEKLLNVRLTAAEAGALISKFSSRSGSHCVDGKRFLNEFYLLGRAQRLKSLQDKHMRFDGSRSRCLTSKNQKVDACSKQLGR